MKIFSLFFIIYSVKCLTLDCEFSYWASYGYTCNVKNLQIVSAENRKISDIKGGHWFGFSNDQVKQIYINRKTVIFFPRHLEKFFKNLETIVIYSSSLTEITAEDLKPHGKLENFWLNGNQIDNIHENLFKANKNLKSIDLNLNKIIQVDSGAFSGLTLKSLYFKSNPCYSGEVKNNPVQVVELIKEIERKCSSFNFDEILKSIELI